MTMELLLTETADGVDSDNPVEGDLHLSAGDLVWTTDLGQEVAQRLRVRFRFFRREWFLDRREGTPWYGEILVKDPSSRVIRAILRNLILGTPGVAALDRLDFSLDHRSRELDVDFQAKLENGATFRATEYGPFIVEF